MSVSCFIFQKKSCQWSPLILLLLGVKLLGWCFAYISSMLWLLSYLTTQGLYRNYYRKFDLEKKSTNSITFVELIFKVRVDFFWQYSTYLSWLTFTEKKYQNKLLLKVIQGWKVLKIALLYRTKHLLNDPNYIRK